MIRSRYSGTFANERCQYKGLCGGFAYIPSIGSENPWYTVLWQITIFNDFVLYSTYEIKAYGKLTKSGIPGWFLNKIGYRFFRDNPARKIFHATGKLPTVTTVMQPQQHC